MDEWLLVWSGKKWLLVARDSTLQEYTYRGEIWYAYMSLDGVFVKVYSPPGSDFTAVDCEIGWHEKRLTVLQRLKAVLFAAQYWDIPF